MDLVDDVREGALPLPCLDDLDVLVLLERYIRCSIAADEALRSGDFQFGCGCCLSPEETVVEVSAYQYILPHYSESCFFPDILANALYSTQSCPALNETELALSSAKIVYLLCRLERL